MSNLEELGFDLDDEEFEILHLDSDLTSGEVKSSEQEELLELISELSNENLSNNENIEKKEPPLNTTEEERSKSQSKDEKGRNIKEESELTMLLSEYETVEDTSSEGRNFSSTGMKITPFNVNETSEPSPLDIASRKEELHKLKFAGFDVFESDDDDNGESEEPVKDFTNSDLEKLRNKDPIDPENPKKENTVLIMNTNEPGDVSQTGENIKTVLIDGEELEFEEEELSKYSKKDIVLKYEKLIRKNHDDHQNEVKNIRNWYIEVCKDKQTKFNKLEDKFNKVSEELSQIEVEYNLRVKEHKDYVNKSKKREDNFKSKVSLLKTKCKKFKKQNLKYKKQKDEENEIVQSLSELDLKESMEAQMKLEAESKISTRKELIPNTHLKKTNKSEIETYLVIQDQKSYHEKEDKSKLFGFTVLLSITYVIILILFLVNFLESM